MVWKEGKGIELMKKMSEKRGGKTVANGAKLRSKWRKYRKRFGKNGNERERESEKKQKISSNYLNYLKREQAGPK